MPQRTVGPTRRATLSGGVLLAAWTGGVAHLAHAGAPAHGADPWAHYLRDTALAVPGTVAVVAVAAWVACRAAAPLGLSGGHVTDRLGRRLWLAASLGVGVTLATIPAKLGHDVLLHGHGTGPVLTHVLADAAVVGAATIPFGLALAVTSDLAGAAARLDVAGLAGSVRRHAAVDARRIAVAGLVLAVAAPLAIGDPRALPAAAQDDDEAAEAQSAADCGPGSSDRSYDVSAINVELPWNRWGDVNPHGQIYVLDQDKAAVERWHEPLADDPADDPAGNRRLRPRPLVLRANAGECVRVDFTNDLDDDPGADTGLPTDPRASMSIRGIPVDAHTSAGGATGYNDDTTVPNTPGENQITYYWHAPEEGLHLFRDEGAPAGAEGDGGSLSTGLYGALAIQPDGSEWFDPRTGEPLYTGTTEQSGELYVDAIIDPPEQEAFRESVQISQDELLGLGEGTDWMGFNYGTEPMQHRVDEGCPDCVEEETALSSWPYGDPGMVKLADGHGPWEPDPEAPPEEVEDCGLGTPGFDADSCWTANVTHAYPNDPTKIRFAHAGVKETHVFHLHTHQWPQQEGLGENESVTIDSQSVGPMEAYTADLIGGAGSVQGTVGDSIFHCHLYPHFADGFWSLLRVHDVREDGTNTLPDGTNVAAVQPLPDRTDPPVATADNPGFPRFVPGEFGWRAPQPPNTVTQADGTPARRSVAGEELLEQDVETETAVRQRMHDTAEPDPGAPGAPFVDPCPDDARQVTYDVSLIQLPVEYNREGWFDSQARIFVLDDHVDEVMAGERDPEPLFVRANEGDCVNWNLTVRVPNWYGNDAFLELKQTNMYSQHVHLLKFDVLASDGASNGWNYEQAAYTREQADYHRRVLDGEADCTAEPRGCTLDDPHPDDWGPDEWQAAAEQAATDPGQTIHARWYADSDLRTVFTHDHHFAGIAQNRGVFAGLLVEEPGADFRDPATGEFFQPIDDPEHGEPCGQACTGDAAGAAADVIAADGSAFREYGLFVQDFVYLTREGGDPQDRADAIEAPPEPEAVPDSAHGVTGINLRNAHLSLRYTRQDGTPVDPAYLFSSRVHDDPRTPLLEAYNNDDIRFRVIQGAHEEQHMVGVHGHRWQRDRKDPDSPFTNAQSVGLSEAFDFEGDDIRCRGDRECRGDYLYGGFALDSLYAGMWGIFRIHGRTVPHLLPLPDNPDIPEGGSAQTLSADDVTGQPPDPPETPGHPCPTHAPRQFHDVVALDTPIDYNADGDHDPYGLVYARAEDVDAIRGGDLDPEPLVLHAREGDCLEITLSNEISEDWLEHGELGRRDGDAPQFGEPEDGHPGGLRVSLHPQMLDYDVRGSDGATIGFNPDQTVGPGEEITYRWHVPDVSPGELGGTNLLEFGDVRGHRHHGLYAALNVQPREATPHDPVSGERVDHGAAVDVRAPGAADHRDFTALVADGLNIRDADGVPYPDLDRDPAEPAAEDAGQRALNYRTSPHRHRIGAEPFLQGNPDGDALAGVYRSERHGDPDTPIFRSLIGDPARVRLLQGADKFRPQSMSVIGHSWRVHPHSQRSRLVGTRGKINTGQHWDAHLSGVGTARGPGDWRLGSEVGHFHRSGGVWGLLRSYQPPEEGASLVPAPVADRDDPREVDAPVLPLELDQLVVTAFHDEDASGVRVFGEEPVAGAQVTAVRSGFASPSATTAADGVAELSVQPGSWTLGVDPPDGWQRGYTGDVSVTTSGDNDFVFVDVPLRPADAPDPGTDPPDTDPEPAEPPPEPGDDGVGPIPPPDEVVGGVHRLFGVDRIATAVAISREQFREAGDADAVVLARADAFPDALAGTPLAVDRNAPLLLTNPGELHPRARDELIRVLDAGTVHLLGGTAALSEDVADEVAALGYDVERHSGPTRFETAIAVARDALGDPEPLLLATGVNFPDALTAGAAASTTDGAVLLTNGEELTGSVADYLDGRGDVAQIAIGGPSARAAPDAEPVFGAHRWATAVAVAERFFTDPDQVGVASGHDFPDALAGSSHIGTRGGPILLSDTGQLGVATREYIDDQRDSLAVAFVYGGRAVLAETVVDELRGLIE